MNSKPKRLVAAATLAAVLIAALYLVSPWLDRAFFPDDYRRFDSVKVGMSEHDVRGLLGAPDVEHTAEQAPEEYYVAGYSFKRREITGKVLIYHGIEHIAYVYLDDEGRTEEIFIGGS